MDPATHAVIGMAVSKITDNQIDLSNPASVGIIIGSIFPDIDILLQKWGDYAYLKNHRCATHSILGVLMSSVFIALVLCGLYGSSNLSGIFLWTLVGGASHVAFDIFNSYGTKVLWPFYNKKFSVSLLIVFDPFFIVFLIGYIFSHGQLQTIFLYAFAAYLIVRALMRLFITIDLKRRYGETSKRISLLPSMTGLHRWHFVIEGEDYNLIGEKNILKPGVKIVRKLYKIKDEPLEGVLLSPLGKFFSEFTPLFHIAYEKIDGITKYVFIDMRYYVKNNFLHHAFLELDDKGSVVKATFNPYSIKRSNSI